MFKLISGCFPAAPVALNLGKVSVFNGTLQGFSAAFMASNLGGFGDTSQLFPAAFVALHLGVLH